MPRLKLLTTAIAALGLAACSTVQPPLGPGSAERAPKLPGTEAVILADAPTPVGHPLSGQREFQTAQHWEALARDLASGIAQARKTLPTPKRPLYLPQADPRMPFHRALRGYLITYLIENGQTVAAVQPGADRLHLRIEPIQHEHNTNRPPPGSIFALAAGAGIIEEFNGVAAPFVVGGAIGEFVFNTNYLRFDALSEVIVTASVVRDETIMARMTTSFYVDNRELVQYLPSRPAPPVFVAASSAAEKPLAVRRFNIVGDIE